MVSNVKNLVPLFASDRGDLRSSDIHLFRSMERPGPVTSNMDLRLAVGKLSVAAKLIKRRGNEGTLCVQDNSKELRGVERNCIVEGSTYSSFISRDHDPKMTRFGFEHNIPDIDVSGRNFLHDAKWMGHTTYSKCDFRERRLSKPNFIPPLPRDYQVHGSNSINRFMLHKELSHSHSHKPFAIGSYDGYDLPSVPAIVFPVTAQSWGKKSFSTDTHINGPRGNNQACGLFRIGANKKSYAYIDPVYGASASFMARLSQLTSLEGETMRQENLKRLKKTKRLES